MRPHQARLFGVASASILLAAAATTTLSAGEAPSVPEANTFGTSALTYLRVPAIEFFPANGSGYKSSGFVGRYPVGESSMFAPLHLPGGSRIKYLEVDFCDTADPQDILLHLLACIDAGSACASVANVNSFANPGCSSISTSAVNSLVDNQQFTTMLFADFQSVNDPALVLTGVVVGYQLQVSPSPAVATFNDVPTGHPFFQFIEALAAAGITGGCGGGNYCPDTPITRGQMAVFLAKALGLHWPI